MRKLLLLLLVLLLTATVGCGGTSPDADSNSNSHEKKVKSQAQQLFTPSELLTKEDAEKILSEPVGIQISSKPRSEQFVHIVRPNKVMQ